MEKTKKRLRIIIIIFLIFVAILTFFSSTINQLGVARVEVYSVQKGNLKWDIHTEGRIVAKDEINIYPDEPLKVKAIHVKEKDLAEQGQLLIEFDTAGLQEQLAEEEIRYQEFVLDSEKNDIKLSESVDPDDSQTKKTKIENDRTNSLKHLDEAYKMKMDLAVRKIELAEEKYANVKTMYDVGGETLQNLKLAEEGVSTAEIEYKQLLADKETEKDTINKESDDKQTTLAQEVKLNQSETRQKQQTLSELQIQRKSFALSQQNSQFKIERLKEKISSCANIYAPKDLIVQEVNIEVGMIAALGTPLMKTADQTAGLQVKFILTDDELQNVFPEDKVRVKSNTKGRKPTEAVIKKISVKGVEDSKEPSKETWAEGDLTDYQLGDKISIDITKESQPYEYIIPTNAIRTDGYDKYVYIVRERGNSLGQEFYLQKAKVRVEDSDGSTTAISDGLFWTDRVVVAGSKPLFEGDKVRIVNKVEKDGEKNENESDK